MGSRGRPVFDLNEPPAEEEHDKGIVPLFIAPKTLPSSTPSTSGLFQPLEGCQRIVNNQAFKHASSCSGFQPFVRVKEPERSKESKADDSNASQRSKESKADDSNAKVSSSLTASQNEDSKVSQAGSAGYQDSQVVEREEGEWSDMEGNDDALLNNAGDKHDAPSAESTGEQIAIRTEQKSVIPDRNNDCSSLGGDSTREVGDANKELKVKALVESEGSRSLDSNSKGHAPVDNLSEPPPAVKLKEFKGVEASYAQRISNNHAKRPKLDEHKEAMLGKKRARQTVFINMEDAKQAGPIKTSAPRRQTSFPSIVTRTVKDIPC